LFVALAASRALQSNIRVVDKLLQVLEMIARISHIQIQTIDACNSACLMCPYKSIEHSGKSIDDDLYMRIIKQIAVQMSAGRIDKSVELNLFFLHQRSVTRQKKA
jgi:sulfatase maturation enzyme AslB (radical SAM superfamily)